MGRVGNARRHSDPDLPQLGQWVYGPLKTPTSHRTVPLYRLPLAAGWLADDLRAYLAQHPHRNDPAAPLFPGRHSLRTKGISRTVTRICSVDNPATTDNYNWFSPIDLATFYDHYFKSALRAVGLPATAPAKNDKPAHKGIRFHDLRHSFGEQNLNHGVPFRQVQGWMGHSSPTVTLNTYGGRFREDEIAIPEPRSRPTVGNVVRLRAA